tara:strand:- start:257 stop:700 length:444 start_codon:yes stop_codon:yes gene_type:complete
MNNNDNKYLVLRGKNKDIFFIQKRLSKNLSNIIGKDFIKKSLETKNIDIARKKRDEILAELDLLSKNAAFEANITNNIDKSSDRTDLSVLEVKNTQFEGFSDKNEGINSNYIKLNNFSWEMKDLIMKIDKLIPFAILVLTLLIAFVA